MARTDKLLELTLCTVIMGILAWFVISSGLVKLIYYIILGKI